VAEYRLLIKPSAAREIESLEPKRDRQRIIQRISALSIEPRPPACEKLSGSAAKYRIRQGDYRIVYAIDDTAQIVEIVKVGHRRDVYRAT
jgi:mRNA interferase RelE/StbE